MNSETILEDPAMSELVSATPIEVRCVQGLDGLVALRDDWIALTRQLPDARFHHDHAWYLSYLRHLEHDPDAVRFFTCHRGTRLVAIFPLRLATRAVAGLRLRLWELPYHAHMNLCDALIARSEDGATLLAPLLHALRQRPLPPWDALHLPNLLDGTPLLHALRHARRGRVALTRTGQSMYFPCADIATALRNASGPFRRNLRRQRRKLDQHGNVEVTQTRARAALNEALADFLRLEASGWKGSDGRGSAIMLNPDLDAFYRALTDGFGADGRCAINLLKLDGRVIAAQYGLVVGSRFNLLKIAYDETFAAEAPGSQLLHAMLETCCETAAIAELSLTTGPGWAAGRWNPETHDVWRALVFNASARGLAAHALMHVRGIATGMRARLMQRRTKSPPQATTP